MKSLIKKYYNTRIVKLYIKLSCKIASLFDLFFDIRLSGASLRGTVRAEDGTRATSEPMRYAGLKEMFKDEKFLETDNFIDIGCGKGRVLAYMNHIGFKGKITGVEYNPMVCDAALKWTEKHSNITVLNEDAFNLNFDDYNVFYLFKPFYDEENKKFIEKIESDLTHSAKIYYYNDRLFRKNINEKTQGWSLLKKGVFFNKGLICYIYTPQHYSVWEYNPKQKN